MIRTTALAILMLIANSAVAQNSPLSLIQIGDASPKNKTITIDQIMTEMAPATETYTVNVGGKPETRTRTVMRAHHKMVKNQISLAGIPAYEASGQELTEEQLWRKIKPGEVIVTVQGELPSSPYLNVLRPETLIVVLPGVKTAPPQAGPMPPPPPQKPPQ